MKAITTSLSILALAAAVAVGCSDSGTGKVGEKPGERTPSASPPTAAPDVPARSQGGGTTDTTTPTPPPPSTISPSDRPASR